MRSLSRAVRARFAGGERMPSIFPALSMQNADARRGEILMIVGQPSAGKSAVALWMATTWTWRDGLRGIYFSADVTAKPAAARAASMLLGNMSANDAQDRLENGDKYLLGVVDDLSKRGMEWCFDPDISADNLNGNLLAFEEKWGEVPSYIIVDNLTDVDTRDGDEGGALRATVRDVNYMARETNAACVVLHHVSEDAREVPIPARKHIMFKVSVKPTIVLGTARTDRETKPIGILKNRYGFEDRSGQSVSWFPFNPNTLQFGSVPILMEGR
jgi:KaiC/GvpD/RAD55 family RecA-like ATPase